MKFFEYLILYKKHIILFWKLKIKKNPDNFTFISNDIDCEGKAVGPELSMLHATRPGVTEWACRYMLTREVTLNNLDANAYKITFLDQINDASGLTFFQPYKI